MSPRIKLWITFFIIIAATVLAGLADWPTGPDIEIGSFYKELKLREGLDLQGGTHLVYEADMEKIGDNDRAQAMVSLKNVIDRRINAIGVAEPVIQTGKIENQYTLIVELPGIKDIDKAMAMIGQTAQLQFVDQEDNELLNGSHLRRADVVIDQQTSQPEISLEFNNDGKTLFAKATQENLQKQIGIKLDNQLISAPTVQTVIPDGKASITGEFTLEEAKNLVIQLNAGALPVPIKIIGQRNIGATLGDESIKQSLIAASLGIFLVALFMILYYRLNGLLAIAALGIYGLINLALFKLIPVTLTLAGIAGFILSIGMAVDANILIFERMKEELAAGKSRGLAIEEGFRRAWSSIRDSNVSSIITCLILIWLGSGLVRGFAVTLIIGILTSMFTAITVTRTFLRLIPSFNSKIKMQNDNG